MRIFLLLLFVPFALKAQPIMEARKKLGPNPLRLLDTSILTREVLLKLDPNDVAQIKLLYDSVDTKAYGDAAKDGVIIFTTKIYAKKKYIEFFRSKSPSYDSLYKITGSDSTYKYVINDKTDSKNIIAELYGVDEDHFISLQIISADELKKRYNVTDKSYGILLLSKPPNSDAEKPKNP